MEDCLHKEAAQFVAKVKDQFPTLFNGMSVLDVGSLEIDGGARQFFTDCNYLGIDLGEGPGVDRVLHVGELATVSRVLNVPNSKVVPQFSVVISTEALEHDHRWAESLKAMYDLLLPCGLLIITCAGPTRWEHGTEEHDAYASPFTTDYYRNLSIEDFASVLPANLFSHSYLGYRGDKEDLYFAGIKQGPNSEVATQKPNELKPESPKPQQIALVPRPTVTVEISTLNRYFTTLPMTIASVATQTRKPERVVLYDDGEQSELREVAPYTELFHLLEDVGIEFETFKTPRLGLAANHQHALETCKTDFLLRVDDDHVLEPDCIEKLLKVMEDETVGAVAPLVLQPGQVRPLPAGIEGKVEDIFNGVNLQWFTDGDKPRETEHLYSCYLFRTSLGRAAGGYPKLSPVSFREDSWFSMKLKRAGGRLIVDPTIKVWHLQQATGGVRAFSDGSLWAQDDALFREWLASCGVEDNSPKLIVGDFGIGDTFCLKSVLPKLREIHKDRGLVIAISHLGILEDEGLPLISIAEAQQRLGARYTESSIYAWMGQRSWNRPMTEAMLEFWGK